MNKRIIDLPDLPDTIPLSAVYIILDGYNGKMSLDKIALPSMSAAIDNQSLVFDSEYNMLSYSKPLAEPTGINEFLQINGDGTLSASDTLYLDSDNTLRGIDLLSASNINAYTTQYLSSAVYYRNYTYGSSELYQLNFVYAIINRYNYIGATGLSTILNRNNGIELCDSENPFEKTSYARFSKKGNVEYNKVEYLRGLRLEGSNVASINVDGTLGFDSTSPCIINRSTSAAASKAVVSFNSLEYDLVSNYTPISYTITSGLSASEDFAIYRGNDGIVTFNGSLICTSAKEDILLDEVVLVINDNRAIPDQNRYIIAPMTSADYTSANLPGMIGNLGISNSGEVVQPIDLAVSRIWLDSITYQTNVVKFN